MRAILLASATAASFGDLRLRSSVSQGDIFPPRRTCWITEVAPTTSTLRNPSSPARARDDPKFLRPRDAGKAHEVLYRVLIDAARMRIAEIGEPRDFGRHVGQPVKLGCGQQSAGRRDLGRKLIGCVAHRSSRPCFYY